MKLVTQITPKIFEISRILLFKLNQFQPQNISEILKML